MRRENYSNHSQRLAHIEALKARQNRTKAKAVSLDKALAAVSPLIAAILVAFALTLISFQ